MTNVQTVNLLLPDLQVAGGQVTLVTPNINLEETVDDEVDWLECISAIETDQGLLYFCDAEYGKQNKHLSVLSEFRASFPEGSYIYSITGYNPLNRLTNRVINELANQQLLHDLSLLLPGCKLYNNFSYFPSKPQHLERGFTIHIPPDYSTVNHSKIVCDLAIKYRQAAFFKGVVLKNGLTIPYVILVQGEYTEIKEQLVTISRAPVYPSFLHKANHPVFSDITEALHLLYQTRENISLCGDLYDAFKENFQPINEDQGRYPIVAVEGFHCQGAANHLSRLMNARFYGNLPSCMDSLREKCTHSTVLLAAFKTIADYIQASQIAKAAEDSPVVIHKYWCNTAASLIATEISRGKSNLPPKEHDVYKWPDGLLKPDAMVLLKPKKASNDRMKLKAGALSRMGGENVISVYCKSAKTVDVTTSFILDKLVERRVIPRSKVAVVTHCPASQPVKLQATSTLDLTEPLSDRLSVEDQSTAASTALDGKPFWW